MKILATVIAGIFLLGCNDEVKEVKEEPQAKKEVKKPAGVKSTVAPTRIVTGESLYKKCASCHGVDASKKALGKSEAIKGWSVARLTEAIEGYKNGTYGREMKTMMKGQVQHLNAVDINILSNYISKL